MPDSVSTSTPSAPASAPPPSSSPAPSSTPSTPSAPSSAPTSTATTAPVSKARNAKEVMERAVEKAKAKAEPKSTSAPDAVKSEESVTAEAKQQATETSGHETRVDGQPEDGLPEKLPDLKPGELPEVP